MPGRHGRHLLTDPEDDLVEEVVALPGGATLLVDRPRSPADLLSDEAFEHEEFLPYWAELWPSGVALARVLAARPPRRGAKVLELGCGLGLPSIVCAQAGARVLATDWSADALRFAERAAARNGVAVLPTLRAAWAEDASALAERGPWDLVLGADVLYERRNVPQLRRLLPRLLAPGATVLIADPGRAAAVDLWDGLPQDGWAVEEVERADPVVVRRLTPPGGPFAAT